MGGQVIADYIRSWDKQHDAWAKRADAADCLAFLVAEMGLKPKAASIDKDGKLYRIYIPLIGQYWQPDNEEPIAWVSHFNYIKHKVQKWALS